MGKQVNVRLDKDEVSACVAMKEQGEAENFAEAVRTAARESWVDRGYLTGREPSTLAAVLNTVGFVTGLLGVLWVLVTLVYPLQIRVYGMAFLLASVGAYTVKWALAERRVQATIAAVLSRGEKA